VGARASLTGCCAAAASATRSAKLRLLLLVDNRDVQLLLSLASEAREHESRDCTLAALLGSCAIS
jgi:hypothetical protein